MGAHVDEPLSCGEIARRVGFRCARWSGGLAMSSRCSMLREISLDSHDQGASAPAADRAERDPGGVHLRFFLAGVFLPPVPVHVRLLPEQGPPPIDHRARFAPARRTAGRPAKSAAREIAARRISAPRGLISSAARTPACEIALDLRHTETPRRWGTRAARGNLAPDIPARRRSAHGRCTHRGRMCPGERRRPGRTTGTAASRNSRTDGRKARAAAGRWRAATEARRDKRATDPILGE